MTEKDYYVPDVKKAKDMSKDLGEYKGVMSRYIDSSDGSMQVKVEQEVLVDRMANTIYTSWWSGVRELLTNELGACKRAKNEYNANPHIVVSINPSERKFVIQGFDSMGITAKRFATVVAYLGRSGNKDRNAIGMFGMGIEAYTTLSDTMMIESNSREPNDGICNCPDCLKYMTDNHTDKCIESHFMKELVGTNDNFTSLGKLGKKWDFMRDPETKLDITTDIPFGCRVNLTLREGIGTGSKFWKKVVRRIEEVVALHGIPTTIHLEDEIDDDDDRWAIGDHEVMLLDHEGYLKEQIARKIAENRYGSAHVDLSHTTVLEIEKDDYDITILYGNTVADQYSSESMAFTTLLDVPINHEYSGSQIHSLVKEEITMDKSLSDYPEFTGILISLKSEEKYKPIASRDNLDMKEGTWLKDYILQSMYDMTNDWYDDNKITELEDLFDKDRNDIALWQHIYKCSTDYNNRNRGNDKTMLQRTLDLRFDIYQRNRKKYDSVSFYKILTKTHDKVSEGKIFHMNKFFSHKITAIEDQIGHNCTFIRLSRPQYSEDMETFNSITLSMQTNILCPDDFMFQETNAWLKAHKIKAVRPKSDPKPKGSCVYHWSDYNNYSYDNSVMRGHIIYNKERYDSMPESLKKKHSIRIQLSNKQYEGRKLSIADVRSLLEQIPTDIAFCKADSHKDGISVDDYVKGVMNRKVHTSVGNMILSKLMETQKKTKDKQIKLMYYPYPEIINEKCFNYDSNVVHICCSSPDELVGLSMAFIINGYLDKCDWAIAYNDKDLAHFGYNERGYTGPNKFKALLPKPVLDFLNTEKLKARWESCEHRGAILLGLIDLHKSIPKEYFHDMAISLTFAETYKEVGEEVKRIKELCKK